MNFFKFTVMDFLKLAGILVLLCCVRMNINAPEPAMFKDLSDYDGSWAISFTIKAPWRKWS